MEHGFNFGTSFYVYETFKINKAAGQIWIIKILNLVHTAYLAEIVEILAMNGRLCIEDKSGLKYSIKRYSGMPFVVFSAKNTAPWSNYPPLQISSHCDCRISEVIHLVASPFSNEVAKFFIRLTIHACFVQKEKLIRAHVATDILNFARIAP